MGTTRALIAALLALLIPCALALPTGLFAVEYGTVACPACLYMEATLKDLGIPLTFVELAPDTREVREYVELYNLVVGDIYLIPFTVIFANETPKLVVVGAVDPQGLKVLIEAALTSPGLMVAVGGERRFITNETVINRVKEVAGARLPRRGLGLGELLLVVAVAVAVAAVLATTLLLRRRRQRRRARERVEEEREEAIPQEPQGLES